MARLDIRVAVVVALVASAMPALAVDIEPFIRRSDFGTVKISPGGEYIAATVPMENTTALAVMRLSDGKVTGGGTLGKHRHVDEIWWVNDERLLFSSSEKMGMLDQPRSTGDIYATTASRNVAEVLVGQSVDVQAVGSRLGGRRKEMVWADMVDTLRADDREVVLAVGSFADDPYTRAERMDVVSGKRTPITRVPVRNGRYVTDNAGVVRAAYGVNVDNAVKTFVRSGDNAEWELVNDEAVDGTVRRPIGFSADNATLYLRSQRPAGTTVIEARDMATGAYSLVLANDNADPELVLHDPVSGAPVGALYMDGKPSTAFFQAGSALERQYRSLEAAFPGEAVLITSATRDGGKVLVHVWSDRNPGDYYAFDTVAKKAQYVASVRSWNDPAQMAPMRPIRFAARDGLQLTGYVTVPTATHDKALPMVVMPHGGPYGIYDRWAFDADVQLLAAAGYAVLQVNYRGSGNRGRGFMAAGARDWGGKMQDDVTDATRWAIAEGIADPSRICIHGGSYGGYASLMGAVREPGLYRCASGYVGVYDLPAMQGEDVRRSRRLGNWSKDWVGDDPQKLAGASPSRLADQIVVPVLLAAGGEDEIAPVDHTRKMERALKAAGVSVETLYYPTEGHGFYVEANRREYYSRLLAFLDRHIGATAGGSAAR